MITISAIKVQVDEERLVLLTKYRSFIVPTSEIFGFSVRRISSFFDEIGIELRSSKSFLVTERADGFFDLAKFLHIEELFGALWYSEAENGRELHHDAGLA